MSHDIQIRTVSNETFAPLGEVTLKIFLHNQVYSHTFLVVPYLQPHILLGTDFLAKYQFVLNFRTNTLHNDKTSIPFEVHSSYRNLIFQVALHCLPHAKSKVTTTIDPFSNNWVPFQFPVNSQAHTLVFQPNPQLYSKFRLMTPHAIISSKKPQILITNPTPNPITIYRAQTLGSFETEYTVQTLTTDTKSVRKLTPDQIKRININPTLPLAQSQLIFDILLHFSDVLAFSLDDLKPSKLPPMEINTENAQPIKHPPFRLSPGETDQVQKHIDELTNKGFIRPSKSPWTSPVFLVKKKNGKNPPCC